MLVNAFILNAFSWKNLVYFDSNLTSPVDKKSTLIQFMIWRQNVSSHYVKWWWQIESVLIGTYHLYWKFKQQGKEDYWKSTGLS